MDERRYQQIRKWRDRKDNFCIRAREKRMAKQYREQADKDAIADRELLAFSPCGEAGCEVCDMHESAE